MSGESHRAPVLMIVHAHPDDAAITTSIDVTPFWPDKLRALGAHASQAH